jgi:hypothetical protein
MTCRMRTALMLLLIGGVLLTQGAQFAAAQSNNDFIVSFEPGTSTQRASCRSGSTWCGCSIQLRHHRCDRGDRTE